ncbi:MAG: RlmE family RNA methyltransferase [Gammaproteobacteria bacterium]|nr:RlmE family RNA methyltransferase [Gammaproteobacteria bacterium]
MSRRSSSNRWYQKQSSDPFVKRREQAGLRSRAAFKLEELLARDRLLKSGQVVLDLGATPGGWSQVVAPMVGPQGLVVAVDILPMEPLSGVTFIRGDATEAQVEEEIRAALAGRAVDLVISDMAPNLTGIRAVDEARSVLLAEQVLHLAQNFLRDGGTMIIKLFQHNDTEVFVREARQHFAAVARRKPAASRSQSREFYLVAAGFRL